MTGQGFEHVTLEVPLESVAARSPGTEGAAREFGSKVSEAFFRSRYVIKSERRKRNEIRHDMLIYTLYIYIYYIHMYLTSLQL